MAQLSIVIPTLGRPDTLTRVLERLERQTAGTDAFEVLVVSDAQERDFDAVAAAVGPRRYRVRHLRGELAGASSARNCGWRAADASVVLFLDDDVLPGAELVAEHLAWHERHPAREVAVLGHVGWAPELRVTPFMRWLEQGVQFHYGLIRDGETHWWHFYTANASAKRELLESAGGFDERGLPFGYEDLDLALRMSARGLRLLYNREARAEHLHAMTLEGWRTQVQRIARAERSFVRKHPEMPPYYFNLFSRALSAKRGRGWSARLVPLVSRGFPWLGARAWASAETRFEQQLAPLFMAAWEAAGERQAEPSEAAPSGSSTGADSSGPK